MQPSVAAETYTSSDGYAHPFHHIFGDPAHLIASVGSTYRRKAKLFVEGEKPRGIFILRTGSAKLTTCSRLGKTIVIRLAEPGDVLGLNAVVSNRPYGVSAEMMASGRVDFIARDSLLRLMKANDTFALAVAEELSASYYSLHDVLRSLGLASHPLERLARLLLSWTSPGNDKTDSANQSFKLPLTHQEIADNIGSTRQTVTRLISDLRRNHLLASEAGELVIMNRLELQRIVHF
jgi:CRP/FNR family transcriptional regulator, cyclic AMP receptor protein